MPLYDHFHTPLSERRNWHSFHKTWASLLSVDLNKRLPDGFLAQANVQFNIEVDVAVWDDPEAGGEGRAIPLQPTWELPVPTRTGPFTLVGDVIEVMVRNPNDYGDLAGAVEIVSPANKDRPATRAALAQKCAAYLATGAGVIVIDVVTAHRGNLHDAMMPLVYADPEPPWGVNLYACAYVPRGRNGSATLRCWQHALVIGQPLPTLPLALRSGPTVAVDFEATYMELARSYRLDRVAG